MQTHKHREQGCGEREAGTGVVHLPAERCQGTPGGGWPEDDLFSLWASWGTWPWGHLAFGLPASGL